MHDTVRQNEESERIGWFAGAVIALLLLSLGFELLAHQVFGPTSMAVMLLSLYLGVWGAALGIAGFIVLSIRWLTEARQLKRRRAAIDLPLRDEPGSADLAEQEPSVHVIELEREDQPNHRSRVA